MKIYTITPALCHETDKHRQEILDHVIQANPDKIIFYMIGEWGAIDRGVSKTLELCRKHFPHIPIKFYGDKIIQMIDIANSLNVEFENFESVFQTFAGLQRNNNYAHSNQHYFDLNLNSDKLFVSYNGSGLRDYRCEMIEAVHRYQLESKGIISFRGDPEGEFTKWKYYSG